MSQFFQGTTAGSLPPSVVEQFVTDTGTVTPVANSQPIMGAVGGNSSVKVQGNGTGVPILINLTDSQFNTIIGPQSGVRTITTASNNVFIGADSLDSLTTGNNNVAVGVNALNNLSTGIGNVALGQTAGLSLTTGLRNIFVGTNSGSNYSSSESNNVIISSSGMPGENNVIRIGDIQTQCFVVGIAGNTVSNPQLLAVNSITNQIGVASSAAAAAAAFQPNSVLNIYEDFLADTNSTNILGNNAWVLNATSAWIPSQGASTAAHPGTIGNASLTTSGKTIALMASASSVGAMILGGGQITFNWVFNIVNLSNSTNRYQLQLGMGDTFATAAQANGVWFQYSDNANSGNWTINTSSASTATNTNSSVAVTTGWHNAQIIINSAGTSAQFLMDGVSLGTVSTNLPVTGISPNFGIFWVAGTVAVSSIIIDLFYLQQILTTPR